jgi:hypothetical protein
MLYLFVPLADIGGRRGVRVASEFAVVKSGLLTELGGDVLSAEAVSRVFVDLLACREWIDVFELSSEFSCESCLDFRLDCEVEMRRHALESEGMLNDCRPVREDV